MADGNIWVAVTAKLLPYSFIFIVMSILANYVFFGVMHIPMDCGFWALNFTSALLVIATQALAVFLFSLFPALSIIISIVSMVGSLGAVDQEYNILNLILFVVLFKRKYMISSDIIYYY